MPSRSDGRRWDDTLSLADEWERAAADWIRWSRAPGHDSYWRFHRDRFLELVPPSPLRVLDMGCGEGRLPRDLKAGGYQVTGVAASPTMVAAARDLDPDGVYHLALAW